MICMLDAFKRVFSNKSVKYTYLDATGESSFSSMSSGDVLKEMNEISTAARAFYDHLHLGNKWNLPGKQIPYLLYLSKILYLYNPNTSGRHSS